MKNENYETICNIYEDADIKLYTLLMCPLFMYLNLEVFKELMSCELSVYLKRII